MARFVGQVVGQSNLSRYRRRRFAACCPTPRASVVREHIRGAVLRSGQGGDAVVLARRSVLPAMRPIADSGCADIPRHSQSLRFPENAMCAGEARPASLPLAKVSCARNGTYAAVMCHQVATRPPSTGIVTPWTKLASSLARKTIAAASSSGSPCRPAGANAAI
jgi:hypothetical protein